MPLYEYECKQCRRHTEKIQKFSDPEITECPYCGGPLERVVSAPAIAFKGGGWYADGYGNAKPSPSKGEGSDKTGTSDKTSDKSSDRTGSPDSAASSAESSASSSKDAAAAPAAAASTASSSTSSADKK